MKELLIGLDIGTSSVKGVLFGRNGQLLEHSAVPISVYTPHPGWVEQDPGDWWQASARVLRQLMAQNDPARVIAIGLSGQCPGHVLVGSNHLAVGRAIIWQDQRAVKEAKCLAENVPADKARDWIGTVSLGDATCPPARLLWLKDNHPQEWEQALAVIQPKDYIALQLTGVIATDRYSAYCLGNVDTGTYAHDYFDLLGIPVNKMPEMLMPTQVVGNLTSNASDDTGLPKGTPVVIGTIDAYCDNLAGGIASPGRAVDVAGTSEILSLAVLKRVMGQGVFPVSMGEEVTFLCGPTQSGGDTLRWLSECFFPEAVGSIPYEKLEQEAASAPAGRSGATTEADAPAASATARMRAAAATPGGGAPAVRAARSATADPSPGLAPAVEGAAGKARRRRPSRARPIPKAGRRQGRQASRTASRSRARARGHTKRSS